MFVCIKFSCLSFAESISRNMYAQTDCILFIMTLDARDIEPTDYANITHKYLNTIIHYITSSSDILYPISCANSCSFSCIILQTPSWLPLLPWVRLGCFALLISSSMKAIIHLYPYMSAAYLQSNHSDIYLSSVAAGDW